MNEEINDCASALEAINQLNFSEEPSLSMDKGNSMPDFSIRSISELRTYGKHLKDVSELLLELHRRLEEQTRQTCNGWNDANAQAFLKDIEDSEEQIDMLAKKMSNFSTYISRICGKFDELMAGIKY